MIPRTTISASSVTTRFGETMARRKKVEAVEESPELKAEKMRVRVAIDECEKQIEQADADYVRLKEQGAPLAHRAKARADQLRHKHAKALQRAANLYGIDIKTLPMPSVDDSPALTDAELEL